MLLSHSVMSDSLRPYGLQPARLPCPSLSPGACSNSCSLSWWCHPTISSSVIPFSSALNLSQYQGLFQWVGSSHQVVKVLQLQLQHQSSNEYSELISFRIDLFDLLAVQGTLKSLLQYHSLKASIIQCLVFFIVQFSHLYMTTGKTIALTTWIFISKMSLLLNMLSRFVIAFLLRSKHLLISWLQSPSAVILEPKKIKSACFHCFPIYLPWRMGPDAFVFWMLNFKPAFSLSSFTVIKRFFSSSSLSAVKVVSSAYLRLLIFLPATLLPASVSSSLASQMMYSAYKLNTQGDNIQPWRTPFSIWNQSLVPCLVLTVASWPIYRFQGGK